MLLPTAYLFPHLSEWALECIERKIDDSHMLLPFCVLPADVQYAYMKSKQWHLYYYRPALLLQVHLHGEAAFDLLVLALERAEGRDATVQALDLLTSMRVPAVVNALVAQMADKEVRAALDRLGEKFPAAVLKVAIDKWLSGADRSLEGWTVRLALRKPEACQTALATLDAARRGKFETLLASLNRQDADVSSLPELLRSPPWLQKRTQQELQILDVKPLHVTDCIAWPNNARAQAAAFKPSPWIYSASRRILALLQLHEDAQAVLLLESSNAEGEG